MSDGSRMLSARAAQALARASRAARLLTSAGAGLRFLEAGVGPVVDLVLRLWVAQTFFVSGLLKLADWNNALRLAAHEYPVAWMAPPAAAVTGATIETLCAALLALGFATRLAAIPMLALALVIQLEYRALNEHLFWALLLAGWIARGAGGLSLDRWLSHGAGDSALPGGAGLARLFEQASRRLAPVVILSWRAGLAAVVLAALAPVMHWPAPPSLLDPAPFSDWLAVVTFEERAPDAALAATAALSRPEAAVLALAAALLGLGLCGRGAALTLAIALPLHAAGTPLTELQQADLSWFVALCAVFVALGPGALSVDAQLARVLRRRYPQLDGRPAIVNGRLPRVVIVGAGFGGTAAARALRHTACEITLVDQRNYHLFQPLLYQVATAGLSPADIATPVRELFRDQPNVTVRMARVTGVDRARREVVAGAQRLPYDFLVLATGARHSYFGKDPWEPFAPGLKQVQDATAVRGRLLLAFERAENTDDAVERAAQLTFAIIGGGPTGVELAGAIAELARHGLHGEFRNIDPAGARVLLVQSAPRLLPTMHENSSADTLRSLQALGVEVLLNSRVEHVDADGITVSGRRIPARTVFWAAGVAASAAAEWLGGPADKAGRVVVGPDLAVPDAPWIFAIGDTASANAWRGQAVPGLAPAAKQGGRYVARVIRARIEGRPAPAPFAYRHLGSLATIGRKAAVADLGVLRLSGPLAWWFWGAVHVLFLASLRNRIAVAIEWFWAYLTFRRSTRLITEPEPTRATA